MPAPPITVPAGFGPDPHATYCRTCRKALVVRTDPITGAVTYLHSIRPDAAVVDHPADPVPLSEITDPVMKCDFCSSNEVVWVYRCANQYTDHRIVTGRTVDAHDYRDRHHAARVRSTTTAPGLGQLSGELWAACQTCADLIDAGDLNGLISHATDHLPKRLTRANRISQTRARLHGVFRAVLDTRAPGRGRITPDQPLGDWEPPPEA